MTREPDRPKRAHTRATQNRAAILERAVDIASAEGLEGLTIGRLAAELKMSKSGLFAHFGSKQELQLRRRRRRRRFRAEVIEPAMSAPEGAPRLRALGDRYSTILTWLLRRLLLGGHLGRVRRSAGTG